MSKKLDILKPSNIPIAGNIIEYSFISKSNQQFMINYNISFYLRTGRGQDDGSAPLYARVSIDQQKYETSLEHNLNPSKEDIQSNQQVEEGL